jgi:hypothetical protein
MPTDDDYDDDRPRRRPRDEDDDDRPRRRSRRDDDDDERPARRSRGGAAFPTGAKVAGIIWIAFGALGIISNIVSIAVNAGQGGAQNYAGIGCGFIIPIAFLMVGIQTVKGSAPSLLANGIGSLIFGALYLLCGVLLLAGGGILAAGGAGGGGGAGGAGAVPAGAGGMIMLLAAIPIVLGLSLLVAGIMALMNKSAYEDWRAAQGLGSKKRRRRTEEETDYDDRPRRRPRDEDDEDDHPRRRRRDDD